MDNILMTFGFVLPFVGALAYYLISDTLKERSERDNRHPLDDTVEAMMIEHQSLVQEVDRLKHLKDISEDIERLKRERRALVSEDDDKPDMASGDDGEPDMASGDIPETMKDYPVEMHDVIYGSVFVKYRDGQVLICSADDYRLPDIKKALYENKSIQAVQREQIDQIVRDRILKKS